MDLDNKNIFEINQSYHFPFIDGDISKNGHFYCVNNQNIPQEENLEINNIKNILQNPENNNDSFSSLNDSRIYFNTNNIKINEPDKEERKIINPDNEISKYKKDLISIKKENKQTSKEGLFITKMPNKSKKKENNISNENLLNKKTKEDREKIHDKYSGDNLRNKCITLVLRHLRNFINEKIKEKYENIGNGKNVEKLLINPSQNVDKKIASYKEFINRTLKEIFSEKISSKYKKYKENHNKSLIDILMNEKNNERKGVEHLPRGVQADLGAERKYPGSRDPAPVDPGPPEGRSQETGRGDRGVRGGNGPGAGEGTGREDRFCAAPDRRRTGTSDASGRDHREKAHRKHASGNTPAYVFPGGTRSRGDGGNISAAAGQKKRGRPSSHGRKRSDAAGDPGGRGRRDRRAGDPLRLERDPGGTALPGRGRKLPGEQLPGGRGVSLLSG